jgi:hypothetical protein
MQTACLPSAAPQRYRLRALRRKRYQVGPFSRFSSASATRGAMTLGRPHGRHSGDYGTLFFDYVKDNALEAFC